MLETIGNTFDSKRSETAVYHTTDENVARVV